MRRRLDHVPECGNLSFSGVVHVGVANLFSGTPYRMSAYEVERLSNCVNTAQASIEDSSASTVGRSNRKSATRPTWKRNPLKTP